MKSLLPLVTIFMFSAVSAQNTDSSQFYYKKGLEEKTARRFLVASQDFEKSIVFNDRFADAYLENGFASLEMRRTDQAKAAFIKVNELDPSNKDAIKQLADLYYSYRQYPKAIEYAKKCTGCENANRIIGISYYQQEDYPSAVKALLLAINQNNNDTEATYTLGRTYLDMEEYKKAVPYYEKAIKLDATKSSWMYELGLLYYNNSDYKNAVNAFDAAAASGYVQSNDFNENLGYACLYSENYEKGEKLLLGIWTRKPGNKDIIRDMAEILYQKKQYDRSLSYCQKLMEMDGKDGKALYQAGLCFQKKGEKDRGEKMCDKAIEIDPSLNSLRQKREMPGGM
ncbi:MAG: tetratricopeptide repeat protein [Ferruginibacter sp.]